jgi:hypothetical protein
MPIEVILKRHGWLNRVEEISVHFILAKEHLEFGDETKVPKQWNDQRNESSKQSLFRAIRLLTTGENQIHARFKRGARRQIRRIEAPQQVLGIGSSLDF